VWAYTLNNILLLLLLLLLLLPPPPPPLIIIIIIIIIIIAIDKRPRLQKIQNMFKIKVIVKMAKMEEILNKKI
jgi:hypothetical protein